MVAYKINDKSPNNLLSLVISQGDSLVGYFKVDVSSFGRRGINCHLTRLCNGLGTSQRFCVHRVEVYYIAR